MQNEGKRRLAAEATEKAVTLNYPFAAGSDRKSSVVEISVVRGLLQRETTLKQKQQSQSGGGDRLARGTATVNTLQGLINTDLNAAEPLWCTSSHANVAL